jgi:hypothetical protein
MTKRLDEDWPAEKIRVPLFRLLDALETAHCAMLGVGRRSLLRLENLTRCGHSGWVLLCVQYCSLSSFGI